MWGSVEMGMAGIESDQHCGLFVSDDLLIIEPVDENLQALKNGADAKKLLITNLFNFSFPLIRYVVDDAVDIETLHSSSYRIAKDIKGRSDEWFVYKGTLKIHPMTFRNILGQEHAISEYQVEQMEQGARISVVLNSTLDFQKLNQQLVAALTDAGLTLALCEIKQIPAIPRNPETGKVRRFIPL